MDTMTAFYIGRASRSKNSMVFDWDKAARIIAERKPESAAAGLESDWEYTGGNILEDGKPNLDEYTYLASTWATPQLQIDDETIDCFIMQDDVPEAWGKDFAHIKWPESALNILAGNPVDGTRPRNQAGTGKNDVTY